MVVFDRVVFVLFFSEGEGERERNIDLLSHLFMHSLVASCMYPDQRLNLQPWPIRTTLLRAELSATWPGLDRSLKLF